MTVMDVGAAAGYTTEMLAAAVGPDSLGVYDEETCLKTDRVLTRAGKP